MKYSGYGRSRGVEGLHDMTYAKVYSAERFAPLPRELFWYPYTPFKYKLLRRFIALYYATTWRERLAALFGRRLPSRRALSYNGALLQHHEALLKEV